MCIPLPATRCSRRKLQSHDPETSGKSVSQAIHTLIKCDAAIDEYYDAQYLWMRVSAMNAQYQSAVPISDLITFAAYAMNEFQQQVVHNVLAFANYKRVITNLSL